MEKNDFKKLFIDNLCNGLISDFDNYCKNKKPIRELSKFDKKLLKEFIIFAEFDKILYSDAIEKIKNDKKKI